MEATMKNMNHARMKTKEGPSSGLCLLRFLATGLCAGILMAEAAQAASVGWEGTFDSNWNLTTNWNSGFVPGKVNFDTAVLSGTNDHPVVCTPIEVTNSFSITISDGAQLRVSREMARCVDFLLGPNAGSGGGQAIQAADVKVASDLRIGHNAAATSGSSYTVIGGALVVADELYVDKGVLLVDTSAASLTAGRMTLTTNADLKFDFDTYGTAPVVVSNLLTIANGAKLEIDLRGYTIGGNVIELIKFGSISGTFAPQDVTIIGLRGGTLTYGANSITLSVVDDVQGPVSAFWFKAKPGTTNAADLEVNTGRIIRNLSSTALTYTRAANGDDLVYSVVWNGSDFNGDSTNDTISFDLRVEGFSGTNYIYSATNGASSVTLGNSASVYAGNGLWGIGSDKDLDAGESLRFSVENVYLSSTGYTAKVDGFVSFYLDEVSGNGHKIIIGEGTGLNSGLVSSPTRFAFSELMPLAVTGAGSATTAKPSVGEVAFKISVANPSNPNPEGDASDYSAYSVGPQMNNNYPAVTNFSNFPEFSWDRVPRWAFIGGVPGSNAAASMAKNIQIISVASIDDEAQLITSSALLKSFNPKVKTLLYLNTYVNYDPDNSTYNSNLWNKYTLDANGARVYENIRQFYVYNHDYPEMSKWWVDTATRITARPEVDGVFVDKAGSNFKYINDDGQFESPLADSDRSYYNLWSQVVPGTLLIGNTLRNEREGGSRGFMQILSGSYLERWDLPYGSSPIAQTDAEAKCVSIQLMREAALKGKILMPAFQDYLDNQYIRDELAAGRDAELLQLMRQRVTLALAYYLIVAEKYSYFRYQADQNMTYPQFIWDPTDDIDELTRPLGPPLGPPVKNGFIYTRSFQYVDVWLNVETDEAVLTWKEIAGERLIGQDDFDGSQNFLSRTFSSTVNNASATWDIVNRSTVQNPDILDTTLFLQNGSAGDTNDSIGYLESTKTDNFFGIERGGSKTLTYTFDISGYTNLNVAMDWVASDNYLSTVTVTALIDGRSTQEVFSVRKNTTDASYTMENGRVVSANNSAQGYVNGVTNAIIYDQFVTFKPTISGAGSNLTLIISQPDSLSGELGLDNLKLYGTPNNAYDIWVAGQGLSGTNAAKTANPDGDAYNNLQEYIAGLNPNMSDRFAISNISAGTTSNRMSWNSVSNRVYNVYWTSNLIKGFTLVGSNVLNGVFLDTNHARQSAAFYKISVQLKP
jgi:hypothetical protein